MPVLCAGLITCVVLEKLKWFDYGATLPTSVRIILQGYDQRQEQERENTQRVRLYCQILVAIFLIFALAFHLASVGLIGAYSHCLINCY